MKTQRFQVGTQYMTRGKNPLICTVVDFLVTKNLAGEIVKTCYVSTHLFCGQVVTDFDVCETTIARNLIEQLAAA